jgi:uncharacterized coiled-coil protein SlyX
VTTRDERTGRGQLLDRVIQWRRRARAQAESDSGDADRERRITELERRVEYLEALFEGLQDSVHREGTRQQKEIEALEAKTQASRMARDLGKYSREHGL